jgi:hypothetical protein
MRHHVPNKQVRQHQSCERRRTASSYELRLHVESFHEQAQILSYLRR